MFVKHVAKIGMEEHLQTSNIKQYTYVLLQLRSTSRNQQGVSRALQGLSPETAVSAVTCQQLKIGRHESYGECGGSSARKRASVDIDVSMSSFWNSLAVKLTGMPVGYDLPALQAEFGGPSYRT